MKKIKLTKGKSVMVDNCDFELFNKHKWYCGKGKYAMRSALINGKKKHVYMHRLINKTPNNLLTDHINRNTLDNRRKNLRSVNKSLNGMNKGKNKNNNSGHKGVHYDSFNNKWRAEITKNYKKIKGKRFSNIKDAINERLMMEQKYYANI